jgi:hypothetical protein
MRAPIQINLDMTHAFDLTEPFGCHFDAPLASDPA